VCVEGREGRLLISPDRDRLDMSSYNIAFQKYIVNSGRRILSIWFLKQLSRNFVSRYCSHSNITLILLSSNKSFDVTSASSTEFCYFSSSAWETLKRNPQIHKAKI
jgi:hypothetical protein